MIGLLIFNVNSNGGEDSKSGYVPYVATAYCLKGRTASGSYVRNGIIAADRRVLKLGSRVHIKGLGHYQVTDTGGAIKGRRIDVWIGSCSQARVFGRRTVLVKPL